MWVAPSDGTWVFDTAGSDFDVTLVAYSDCGAQYELGCTYDWGGGFGTDLSVGLQAGDAVILAVGGLFGSTGNWQLNINELGELDTTNPSFYADFFVWFNYTGDADATDVFFVNAVDPDTDLGDAIRRVENAGQTYELFRVRGRFKP